MLLRSDLIKILARKELTKIPARNQTECYIRTILGQRSLAPVSNYCIPRFTSFEDSLELFTLPEVIVLCDNLCDTELISDRRNTSGKCDIYTVGSVSRNRNFLEVSIKTGESKAVSRDKYV